MKRVINRKNLKKDFLDPDLKAYDKKIPLVNKVAMKAGLLKKKIGKKR